MRMEGVGRLAVHPAAQVCASRVARISDQGSPTASASATAPSTVSLPRNIHCRWQPDAGVGRDRRFGRRPTARWRSAPLPATASVARHRAARRAIRTRRVDDPRLAVPKLAGSGSLPVALTRFVGRAVDVERLVELAEAERLVTLTGPGGNGKTRLAIAADMTPSPRSSRVNRDNGMTDSFTSWRTG